MSIEEQPDGLSDDNIGVVAVDHISVIHILYAKPEHLIVLWHFFNVVIRLMLEKGEERDVLNHNREVILSILLGM